MGIVTFPIIFPIRLGPTQYNQINQPPIKLINLHKINQPPIKNYQSPSQIQN